MSRPKRTTLLDDMLSEPRTYSDNDIKQLFYSLQKDADIKVRKHVLKDLFSGTAKTKIYFLSTFITLLTEERENYPEDDDGLLAKISKLDKDKYANQISFIIRELSKEI